MGDVTGLVIGAVALASLFSTCIELFDCFQLGKNHADGYRLACNKVDLLRVRFKAWGKLTSIDDPRQQDPALHERETGRHEVVAHSLIGIEDILKKISALQVRHGTTVTHKTWSRPVIFSKFAKRNDQQSKLTQTQTGGRVGLGRRTLWAVHDKQELDTLIQDLGFLVDNLEKVVDVPAQMGEPSHSTRGETPRESTKSQSTQPDPPPRSDRNPPVVPVESRHERDSKQDTASERVRDFDNLYLGNQTNKGPLGVMGNIEDEPQNSRNKYYGDQDNSERTIGVMGNVSSSIMKESWISGRRD